ncbi:hypothetical protein ASG87_01645 [Frateuria sp. Soil773]|uniref:hypothetical protein n=1 Tax=Frateuria sp. Soil773 TaxID=1736407 RepID=UPI0007000CB5|nr:hypothetical protein [Frateuria sp. Soil773]KRE90868.1 hypothetical protein ASG87_01645 [Frateuria sp. Soil773]
MEVLIPVLLALGLFCGGVWAINRFGAGQPKAPPLHVTEDNGWTVIVATPAPLPKRLTAISVVFATGLAVVVWVAFMIRQAKPVGATLAAMGVWLTLGIVIRRLWQTYHDHRRQVVHQPLSVCSRGIRLGATMVPRDRIYAIVRRNAQDGRVVVVTGHGVAAGVSQMTAGTLALLTQISHTVEVEHDGTRTVLAGGLTDAQAHAVAAELTKRLPGFH